MPIATRANVDAAANAIGSFTRSAAQRCHAFARIALGLGTVASLVASAVVLAPSQARADLGIYVLVNDTPISEFDIKQRMTMLRSSSSELNRRMQARFKDRDRLNKEFRAFAIKRKPQTQAEVKKLQAEFVASIRRSVARSVEPQLRKNAVRELVNEQLQLQEAKRLNINIDDNELNRIVGNIAKNNGKSLKDFENDLKKQGINPAAMRNRIRSQVAWRQVVRRKFGRQITVDQEEIDALASNLDGEGGGGTTDVELRLRKITIPLSGRIDEAVMAQRYAAAEDLRRRFRSCETTEKLAARVQNAKHETLGSVKASALPAEARPLLGAAGTGQMTPPIFTSSGIELYAVCGRREVVGDTKVRKKAKDQLEQQQFRSYSSRLLRDLCTDALLEFKEGERPATKPCGDA